MVARVLGPHLSIGAQALQYVVQGGNDAQTAVQHMSTLLVTESAAAVVEHSHDCGAVGDIPQVQHVSAVLRCQTSWSRAYVSKG